MGVLVHLWGVLVACLLWVWVRLGAAPPYFCTPPRVQVDKGSTAHMERTVERLAQGRPGPVGVGPGGVAPPPGPPAPRFLFILYYLPPPPPPPPGPGGGGGGGGT